MAAVREAETRRVLGGLTAHNEMLFVARGGKGGLGSDHFKTTTNVGPHLAGKGEAGAEMWLDLEIQEPGRLRPLLVPYPAEDMEAYPVGALVNSPGNDDERCIRPVA